MDVGIPEREAAGILRAMRARGDFMMFGNRKRFLRVGDRIFNLEKTMLLRYNREKKLIEINFDCDGYLIIDAETSDDFEQIARALKCWKVKA